MLPATKRNYNAWLPSVFDNFFNDEFFVPARQYATPAVNIGESEKEYEIQVAAPGMTKDNFKIELNRNNELVISLEKKSGSEEKDEKRNRWLRKEFSYSAYTQRFALPEDVDTDNIVAKMEHGVLGISLPKKEVSKAENTGRLISIQ